MSEKIIHNGKRGTFTEEDPGWEFMRILSKDIANGGSKPYWMTSEFHEEERNQSQLAMYNESTWLSRLFLRFCGWDMHNLSNGPPRRIDGSLVTYHNMKDDTFYLIKKKRNCNVCGNEYIVGPNPSYWCEECRGKKEDY